MNEYSNEDIENKFMKDLTKILSSKQEIENHVSSEKDKIVLEIPEELPKKPIKNILFVDDEKAVCNLFKKALEKFGYRVKIAFDGDEGLRLFRKNPADLVITDIFMPKQDGHTLIYDIAKEFPGTNVFALTGVVSFNPEMELNIALKLGATKVFQKPVKISVILDAIEKLAL